MQARTQWIAELESARQARADGNEGRARVCARRAAGIAIRANLETRGAQAASGSALSLLQQLSDDPDLEPRLRPLVDHLLRRVDEKFALPSGVDLIADAESLCQILAP